MKKLLVISLLVSTGYISRMVAFEYAIWRITSNTVSCIEDAMSQGFSPTNMVIDICNASASADKVAQILLWTPQFNQILIEDLKAKLQGQ